MLVLTRKLMEKLYIGDNICVTVVRLEGGQVRLGIEAPREVAVVRAELVPDRQFGPHRGSIARSHTAPHNPAQPPSPPTVVATNPQELAPARAAVGPPSEVKIPPIWAHGNDSRRRGPSR
jgi:carbon storage regulator